MCWYGRKKNLKVAKKDIKVKKILQKETFKKMSGGTDCHKDGFTRIISPYRGSCYEVGETYEQTITPSEKDFMGEIRIDEGLHCYSNMCPHKVEDMNYKMVLTIGKKRSLIKSLLFGIVIVYSKVLNSVSAYKYRPGVSSFRSILLAEFIIPSGTKYYENKDGEIVTEKYIFKNYTEL